MKAADIDFAQHTPALLGEEIMAKFRAAAPAADDTRPAGPAVHSIRPLGTV